MNKRYIYAFPKISFSSFLKEKKGEEYYPLLEGNHVIRLSSGRAAIYNSAKLLNLKENDVVLVPSYHCGVEIEALIRTGVKIRYYPVTPSMGVDKDNLEKGTDDNVKALFIIHYWGFPQDLSWIIQYCKDRRITLIEDCAHALYSKYQGNYLGTVGDVVIYSLAKTLALPNGGILRFKRNNKVITVKRSQRNWHDLKSTARSFLENTGSQSQNPFASVANALLYLNEKRNESGNINHCNYRETPLSRYEEGMSSISSYLLSHVDPEIIIKKRKENYSVLLDKIEGKDGIEIPFKSLNEEVCPLFFPILIEKREELQQYLLQNNIESFVFGRNLHPSLQKKSYPESQFLSDHILGLPVHQDLNENDMESIAGAINLWCGGKKPI